MEGLSFKSKRQEKDFDSLLKRVYFKEVSSNSFSDIIVNVSNLSKEELEEVARVFKSNKNVVVNFSRKMIAIS